MKHSNLSNMNKFAVMGLRSSLTEAGADCSLAIYSGGEARIAGASAQHGCQKDDATDRVYLLHDVSRSPHSGQRHVQQATSI